MAEDDVRINIRLPQSLWERLTKTAEDRVVGISLLASKLLEYGLDNLSDPVWPGAMSLPLDDPRSQSQESLQ